MGTLIPIKFYKAVKNMLIIDLTPLEDGVHNAYGSNEVPNGFAMVPKDFPLPSTFPRLGSITAEEISYPYEVEVEKDVVKYRDVEIIGEDGKPVIVKEEYTEKEMVTEQREKVIMTVTAMTEGTLPEPVEPEPTEQEQMRADIEYLAIMTGVEL